MLFLQPCHHLGTTLYFATILLQGGDKVVAGCHKVVQTVSQGCHNALCHNLGTTLYFETVARLLQGSDKVVTRLYEHCHKVATRLPQCTLSQLLYFETVARLLQGGGNAVTKALSQ